ncbi:MULTISPECIES: PucR family transcriptional regulator [unclassified Micromonospora]|uniref:PucR family transcriptional regulator n=1 Tax=unclassified Micromonospora TaxID=2617518 RepID=UPI003639EDB3
MTVIIEELVAEAARRIEARLPSLVPEMTDHFIEAIPEFRHDDAVQRLMVASTTANLEAIVALLAHKIPEESITVPPAAAEYARRFAQHGLSLEALLRAYRIGHNRFVRWGVAALAEVAALPGADTGPGELAVATDRLVLRTDVYIDRVAESLVEIYESERRRWDGRTDAARTAQLRIVLDNESLSTRSAQDLIGVALGDWHVAAVGWVDADAADPAACLASARRMLAECLGPSVVTVAVDDATLWAWATSRRRAPVDVGALSGRLVHAAGVRITLGAPAPGLAGFRQSHREALRARAVVQAAPQAHQQIVRFDDVAVAALLTDHPTVLRVWVRRVLGDLAEDSEGTARLRQTVRALLACGGSYTAAAALLHVHKNTVHYRVQRAEELRGQPISEGRIDMEVALLACEMLGPRVLSAR